MDNQPPPIKNPDLSRFPRGAISMKGIPLARNTRLPTIRAARDLTLGAPPKRNFQPNIPVRREKKSPTPNTDSNSQNLSETVDNNVSKKFSHLDLKWKKKPKNIVQTEGAPFAEGVVPSTSKAADKQKESVPRFAPKRTVVKKDLDLSDMKIDSDLDELLRDDFIDDDDDEDEEDDIKPIIYPVQEGEKVVKSESHETKPQSFDNNLAKEMGYDVNKIAQFIKKEKGVEEIEKTVSKMDIPACAENELTKLFASGEQQMFLLKLPREFNVIQPDDPQKDYFAEETNDHMAKDKKDISSLPEGKIGTLQILKSGRIRLAVGNNYFYFSQGTALKNKKEVVSIQTDDNNKDLIVLGNIEHTLIVTPDVDRLLLPSR